jgi:glutathione S-transferase
MTKIHGYKDFPNPARIRVALAEKGLTHAVEFVTVDGPAGDLVRLSAWRDNVAERPSAAYA